MPRFVEILELATELDSVIAKGLSHGESDLKKSLSHDPFRPVDMHIDSQFYNPYKWVDNGFMPYEVDHWRKMGKSPDTDSYIEVQNLYNKINGQRAFFRSFAKTIDTDLIKAGAVPVGTVHTYSDGQKYKKVAEGSWQPVANEKGQTKPQDIERHAGSHAKVTEEIKKKTREQSLTEEIKEEARREAQKQVMSALKTIFGDEMPEGLGKHFEKLQKENDQKDIDQEKDAPTRLKEVEKDMKGKKHHVAVEFTHNGKKYNHEFPSVHGMNKEEVSGRVTDMIKKKIPGAAITKLKTTQKEQARKV